MSDLPARPSSIAVTAAMPLSRSALASPPAYISSSSTFTARPRPPSHGDGGRFVPRSPPGIHRGIAAPLNQGAAEALFRRQGHDGVVLVGQALEPHHDFPHIRPADDAGPPARRP